MDESSLQALLQRAVDTCAALGLPAAPFEPLAELLPEGLLAAAQLTVHADGLRVGLVAGGQGPDFYAAAAQVVSALGLPEAEAQRLESTALALGGDLNLEVLTQAEGPSVRWCVDLEPTQRVTAVAITQAHGHGAGVWAMVDINAGLLGRAAPDGLGRELGPGGTFTTFSFRVPPRGGDLTRLRLVAGAWLNDEAMGQELVPEDSSELLGELVLRVGAGGASSAVLFSPGLDLVAEELPGLAEALSGAQHLGARVVLATGLEDVERVFALPPAQEAHPRFEGSLEGKPQSLEGRLRRAGGRPYALFSADTPEGTWILDFSTPDAPGLQTLSLHLQDPQGQGLDARTTGVVREEAEGLAASELSWLFTRPQGLVRVEGVLRWPRADNTRLEGRLSLSLDGGAPVQASARLEPFDRLWRLQAVLDLAPGESLLMVLSCEDPRQVGFRAVDVRVEMTLTRVRGPEDVKLDHPTLRVDSASAADSATGWTLELKGTMQGLLLRRNMSLRFEGEWA